MPALLAVPLATVALFGLFYLSIRFAERVKLPTLALALVIVFFAALVLVALLEVAELGLPPVFYAD